MFSMVNGLLVFMIKKPEYLEATYCYQLAQRKTGNKRIFKEREWDWPSAFWTSLVLDCVKCRQKVSERLYEGWFACLKKQSQEP